MPPRRKQQQQQQPTASVLESLPTNIAKIFEQVQTSKATWTKNSVTLHKLHSQAAQITDDSEPNRIRIIGERAFEIAFIDALNRIVAVKKGTTVADRVVHFIGQWVNTIVTEDAKVRAANPPDEDDNQESTPTTRFTGRIIQHLMKGFEAKDKNVRYRCVQLVAMIVAQLQELDPELYDKLRKALTERINDKEATVRAQAVAVLAKLCGAEDIDELEDDDRPAKEILLEMLAHDASGDVRRAVLVNIRIDAETLPAIIERTRDVEPATRKLVFTHVLLPNIWVKQQQPPPDANANQDGADANEPVMGLTHPRALTIQQREDIVSTGLGDREDAVRAAAGTLVSEWVQALGAGKTTDDSAMEDLLALLSTFDLVSGVTNAVAQDAIKSVLVTRKDIFSALKFEADYWKAEALSPEKIFLARVFIDYCKAKKEDESIEKMLPVVTAWAFHVQSAYNLLSQDMEAYDLEVQNAAEDEVLFEKEEARNARVFVVVEMLRIALVLDYADEVGRRKMFQLIRNMISQEGLPEPLVMPCMDVLRILVNDEADLIRLVVQIVHELRDVMDEMNSLPPEDSQMSVAPSAIAMPQRRPREDMAPEELKRSDDLDIRCLDLCIGMLERINSTFQDHSTLEGMLKELMIPAVMRKEMIFRERGLVCLGLCSLIAPKMAMGTFELFKNQVKTAPEPLKIKVLQIMFDVVMVHEREFMGPPGLKSEIESLLVEQLTDDSSKVRAQVCKGLAKLMLAGMTTANQILCALVMEFFSPDSADNQQLRQCLIYFFPIYCYSSSANQRRMMDNFLSIYKTFLHMHSMLDEGEEMVSPAQFTSMFIEWTNPQHAIDVPDRAYDEEVHLDFAAVIMKELLQPTPFDVDGSKVELRKEDKKVMCQMLPKLFLPIEADDLRVRSLRLLTHKLGTTRPVRDAVAFNAINKFDSALTKHYDAQLDGFDEDEYRKLEELTNLFAFLDDIFGSDDDGELVEPTTKRGRKRRSESITDEDTSEEEDDDSTPRPKKQKGRVGKRRKMAADEDDDEEDDDHPSMRRTPPASAVKTRSMPKRAATKKVDVRAMSVQDEDEEANEDEDDDDPTETTPVPTPKTASSTRHQRAETDDEQEQEHDPPPDSEDDDQEVDALLEEE